MKQKISITVGEETIELVEKLLKERKFRNKSHAFEYALYKLQEEENEKWYIETGLEVKTDSSGQKYLKGKRELLKCPIRESCYVSLDFNEQGMPTRKSPLQNYDADTNIYFCIQLMKLSRGCVRVPAGRTCIAAGFRLPPVRRSGYLRAPR